MIDRQVVSFEGLQIPVYSLNTVVVGSGAAGLNCAVRLLREFEQAGDHDPARRVALITRGYGLGTSYNAGSDKQTYYRLGVHGRVPDSPMDFAATLTAGGCTHGDVALAEAENSLRCFYHLADLGVPFPHDVYGAFPGYKTDHDPRQRATSAGPWTSRYMVQKLNVEAVQLGLIQFQRLHVLAIITRPDHNACGVLCADAAFQENGDHGLRLFNARNIVMAGGGPGELYAASVYPAGQMGPYAALFEAGAAAHNLTESQFGLASIAPRWNLSGTYQQVIPRYYSTDAGGNDPQEFLQPWFTNTATLATDIFLKGYQWPFDPSKATNFGSSLIDILVHHETVHRGRRVFMDFRSNPASVPEGGAFDLASLHPEARAYLERSGATQPRPVERLACMNTPSIELYRGMGVDLECDPIEIGVCAQHCNGGFAVDAWWESNLRHLFVIGELAGTHGVKRPGGSALNAGQTGGLRAAQRIAHVYTADPESLDDFQALALPAVQRAAAFAQRVLNAPADALDVTAVKQVIQARMTQHAAMTRSEAGLREALTDASLEWRAITERGLRQHPDAYIEAAEVRELALTQRAFLEAALAIVERGGGSRGSHLILNPSGESPHEKLGDAWRFLPENPALRNEILALTYDAQADQFHFRINTPRPIPENESWFETVWAAYRDGALFRC